jgi:hypothetical protein
MPTEAHNQQWTIDMKSKFNRTPTYKEICQAIQQLVEEGLVVDSGRKKWSERTGRYEILWVLSPSGRAKQTKSITSLSSAQMIANLKTNRSNSTNQ